MLNAFFDKHLFEIKSQDLKYDDWTNYLNANDPASNDREYKLANTLFNSGFNWMKFKRDEQAYE